MDRDQFWALWLALTKLCELFEIRLNTWLAGRDRAQTIECLDAVLRTAMVFLFAMWQTVQSSKGQLPPDKGTVFRIKAGIEVRKNTKQPAVHCQAILAVKGHPYKHVFHAVQQTCFLGVQSFECLEPSKLGALKGHWVREPRIGLETSSYEANIRNII